METLVLNNKRKLKLTIKHDSDSENPLQWDNSINVVYTSNKYILGNKKVSSLTETMINLLSYSDNYVQRLYNEYGNFSKELFEFLLSRLNKKGFVALPIYAYIHSGVTVSTTPFNCRFDSGLVGFIYTKRTEYITEYGVNKNIKNSDIEKMFNNVLENFNTWLQGDVFYFLLEDSETDEYLGSCGGFYGSNYYNDMVEHVNYIEYGYSKEEMINLFKSTEISY